MDKLKNNTLVCTICRSPLHIKDDGANCRRCNSIFQIKNKKLYSNTSFLKMKLDGLDKFKRGLKKYYNFYNFLIKMISPVCPNFSLKKFISRNVNTDGIFVNLGSGNSCISQNIVNVDIFDYENVDIVADIENTPFESNSVDGVFSIAVLEHVKSPDAVINEIYRILKPGGYVYIMMPFMQGYHASPHDYTRFTVNGLKNAMSQFEQIELKPFGGPTSGLLWILQEYIAIVLSFGSEKLHKVVYILTMLLTWPLKFLDLILIHHKASCNISSGFIFIGVKPVKNVALDS